MIKYICDICKEEISIECGYHRNYISIGGSKLFGGEADLDVCLKCKRKIEDHFTEFLNGICNAANNIKENV